MRFNSRRLCRNTINTLDPPGQIRNFHFISLIFILNLLNVHGQELHQVYMINHGTAVHYHTFCRLEKASLLEAIRKLASAAFPCGVDLLTTKVDINTIMFHFQLYRACHLEVKEVKPISLLGNRTKEQLQKKPNINFEEMAKILKDKSLFGDAKDVTFMVETKDLVDFGEPFTNEEMRDLSSLHINFTKTPKFRRTKRTSMRDLAGKKSLNSTGVSTRNQHTFPNTKKEEYEDKEEPDMDYYSDLTLDEIEMEAAVLMDLLKNSKFAEEGCASKRLEPMETARGMRPFSGDGYILDKVLHDILKMFKKKRKDNYLININYKPRQCFTLCPTLTPLIATTSVCGGIRINDFEKDTQNDIWTVINSQQIAESLAAAKHAHLLGMPYVGPSISDDKSKEENFRVVIGAVQNSTNHYAYFSSRAPRNFTPMIVSAYFQHTSTACELVFRHRIHGIPGAELLVTTQHLQHHALISNDPDVDEEEADDWIRPTLRASLKPVRDDYEQWTTSHVPIGQTLFPTRIRIECHTAQQQRDPSLLNVECNVDDVHLVNCDEEIWKADSCSSNQTKKYLCHKKGPQKCIEYEDVCDMHAECDDAEDESNEIHKCNLVPPGARCDYELNSETGCPHWKIFSPLNSNNGSQYLQRISLANTRRMSVHGLPPAEYSYHGSKRTTGHFLFFSTYGLASGSQPNGEVLYTYAVSPAFPPTSLDTSLPEKAIYRTCMVRFFYCHSGESTFQLILENGADFSHKEVLWTPSKTTGSDPCTWQKASALIPHQDTEYRLKIAFGKLYKQPVSVAVDDFTMTPNCFLDLNSWSSRFVPDKLQINSCSDKDCKEPTTDSNGLTIANDKRSWLVPTNGLYHIQLFGAAGGFLPGQDAKNLGGIVAANFKLQRNQELSFVVGQVGTNPCIDERKVFAADQGKASLSRLWRVVCGKESSAADLELARRDSQNLFGSSGGGATAIFADNNLLGVAGAGAGLYPEAFISQPDNKSDPSGGEIFNETTEYTFKAPFWSAGNGASFGPASQQPNNVSPACADCGQMAGYSTTVKDRRLFLGGYCPQHRLFNITGGFGAGGASCGPGAGGGAGFQGGNAGHNSHGNGGTSAFLIKNAQLSWAKGANSGNGRIIMVRCSLKCPTNSTCAFEHPIPGVEAKQYCQCMNGLKTGANGSCTPSDFLSIVSQLGVAIGDAANVEPNLVFYLLLLFVVLILLIPFLLCYIFMRLRYECIQTSPLMRRIKFFLFPNKRNEEFGDFEMMSSMRQSKPSIAGNLIKENPIYERLVMIELPHVSRHFIQLKKSIGHGAFGEVYEGFFNLDGSITKVAVKTLPIDSNPETDCDFETEARLLNQFNHPNIVKFFGVSFEQQPKYIILEYLEGGDLRNFLRECRPKPQVSLDAPQPLAMIDLIHMALDVAHGCSYLENSKFIHRDIAARNCLLTTKGPDRIVKIGDFGMARDIYSSEYRKGGRAFLAVKWMPPEAFLDGIFNSKTDVWSYGILLWEIFSMGFMPYTLRQNQEVMQLVVAGGRLEPPVGVPEDIYEQMLCCWNTEPEERPNFDQIVDFFTNLATDHELMDLPVPPILHRQTQPTPSSTPSTTRSSIPPMNDDVITQATMTESTNTSVSMPTQGEGINHNVFPAYQSRFSQPLMEVRSNQREGSLSSHDDSTLHDSCSVKQSPYRIDKNAFQTSNLLNRAPLPETLPFLQTTPKNPTPPLNYRRRYSPPKTDSPDYNNTPSSDEPRSPSDDQQEQQTSPLV